MSQFFILRTRLRNQIDTVFLETIGIVILRAITVIVQIDEEEVEINEIVSYIYIYIQPVKFATSDTNLSKHLTAIKR